MGFWENFPYTNFHEINLDWLIKTAKEAHSYIKEKYPEIERLSAATAKNAEIARKSAEKAEQYGSIYPARRYVFVGDSYIQGYTPDGSVKSFAERFKQLAGLTNASVYVAGAGGAGFGRVNSDGINFINCIDTIEVDEPETITDVVFVGGYNDQFALSNIDGGIVQAHEKYKTLFPNARQYIGFVGRSVNYNTGANGDNLVKAFNRYRLTKNMLYIGNIENCCRFTSQFASDGYHPNNSGQDAIAQYLYNFFYGTPGIFKAEPAVADGSVTAVISNAYGTLRFSKPASKTNLEDGASLNGNVAIDLGENIGAYWNNYGNSAVVVEIGIDTVDGWKNGTARVVANTSNGHLELRPVVVSGSGYATAKEGGNFVVPAQEHQFLPIWH